MKALKKKACEQNQRYGRRRQKAEGKSVKEQEKEKTNASGTIKKKKEIIIIAQASNLISANHFSYVLLFTTL